MARRHASQPSLTLTTNPIGHGAILPMLATPELVPGFHRAVFPVVHLAPSGNIKSNAVSKTMIHKTPTKNHVAGQGPTPDPIPTKVCISLIDIIGIIHIVPLIDCL